MKTETIYPRVFCKATKRNVNPVWGVWEKPQWQDQDHFTTMWIELPLEVSRSSDPTDIQQWIGEQFNWTFMVYGDMIPCPTQEHVNALLEEE